MPSCYVDPSVGLEFSAKIEVFFCGFILLVTKIVTQEGPSEAESLDSRPELGSRLNYTEK